MILQKTTLSIIAYVFLLDSATLYSQTQSLDAKKLVSQFRTTLEGRHDKILQVLKNINAYEPPKTQLSGSPLIAEYSLDILNPAMLYVKYVTKNPNLILHFAYINLNHIDVEAKFSSCDEFPKPKDWAQKNETSVLINGNFFPGTPREPRGMVVGEGRWCQNFSQIEKDFFYCDEKNRCYIDKFEKNDIDFFEDLKSIKEIKGKMEAVYDLSSVAPISFKKKFPQIYNLASGPILLKDGRIVGDNLRKCRTHAQNINPGLCLVQRARTAIGMFAKKQTALLMVVEENSKEYGTSTDDSVGISMRSLAEFMQIFAAKDAISLDGGGSSAMIIGSQKVSYPRAPDTMRQVANVLGFKYKADANVEASPAGIKYPIHWQSKILSVPLLENAVE